MFMQDKVSYSSPWKILISNGSMRPFTLVIEGCVHWIIKRHEEEHFWRFMVCLCLSHHAGTGTAFVSASPAWLATTAIARLFGGNNMFV